MTAARAAPLDQAEIARCDALLVAGVSLVDEAPLAALAARTVVRRGGRLFVVNAGERFLGDVAERTIANHPAELASVLEAVAHGDGGNPAFDAIGQALRAARSPGILAGSDLMDGRAITAAGALARALGPAARLGFVLPGPNGFGAAALAGGPRLERLLADLRDGKFRAAVVVESDLDRLGPEIVKALARLELLVVVDHVRGPLTDAAHVFLPSATTYESAGIYVNRAGRAQAFAPMDVAGDNVRERIHDGRFPREPRLHAPRGDVRPAWWALERLRAAATGAEPRGLASVRADLASSHPFWRPIAGLAPGDLGAVLEVGALEMEGAAVEDFARGRDLRAYALDRTLGSEALSRRSPAMQKMAGPPVAALSRADGERLGAARAVRLERNGTSLAIAFEARDGVPEGVVLVPRDALWSDGIPAPQGAEVRALREGNP